MEPLTPIWSDGRLPWVAAREVDWTVSEPASSLWVLEPVSVVAVDAFWSAPEAPPVAGLPAPLSVTGVFWMAPTLAAPSLSESM